MNKSIKEIIKILEEDNLERLDYTLDDGRKVTAYKLPNIIRIDIKIK